MSELAIIIAVFLCGMLGMLIELFLPGAVLGMMGFLGVVGSIVYAIVSGHTVTATVLIICALAFVPVFFMLWKGVIGRFFATYGEEKDFRPSTTIGQELVGAEGEAATPLRPSGIAYFDSRRYDVVTRGEMLPRGTRVRVMEVSGNRVVVKESDRPGPAAGE
ncbi:MAG: NfeD family protein [Planctomycetota bacterium]|jgi:membrane-bound serine protease (ClpP class)